MTPAINLHLQFSKWLPKVKVEIVISFFDFICAGIYGSSLLLRDLWLPNSLWWSKPKYMVS